MFLPLCLKGRALLLGICIAYNINAMGMPGAKAFVIIIFEL